MRRRTNRLDVAMLAWAGFALAGCGGGDGGVGVPVVRLVDEFPKLEVRQRAATTVSEFPRTEWRFDGKAAPPAPPSEALATTFGFEAGAGIEELAVRDGVLVGRSTTRFPILRVERPIRADDRDVVQAIEVRARASAGDNLSVSFERSEKVDFEDLVNRLKSSPWRLTTPLVPGDEAKTYVITPPATVAARDARHVLVRPTDAEGATFEIESVRVVFRKEHLASIPSGPSWQGLSEIYRETIVARAPETIVTPRLGVGDRAFLDLAIGTVEDRPVTFRVTVAPDGGERRVLLERTVTTPYRWETTPIELDAWAGESVAIEFSLAADSEGTLGFWGAPVLRHRTDAGGGAPRGVVLVMMDTLRRDHLDAYGYARPTAPRLGALAAEGALFRDCVAQATWTKVSTPSILTGMYPLSHGVRQVTDRLPASATTLAEAFREAGRATLSYSSVSFSGKFTNLHQGFEELHERASIPDAPGGYGSKTAREYMDRLLPWIEAHRDVPFFVFLHVFDPHSPFEPRSPYDSLFADSSAREADAKAREAVKKEIADPGRKNMGMPTREEIAKAGQDADALMRHDKDWYDGSIRAMDAEIARLVERLDSLGLTKDTLIVFTADHGEEFLEHGRTFHGDSAYGELSQVPLFFRCPGTVPAGVVVPETVQSIDILPTVLALSGLRAPAEAQGQSLVPLIRRPQNGQGPAPGFRVRPAVTEKAAQKPAPTGENPDANDFLEQYALAYDGLKLVHNAERTDGRAEYELYDRASDPLDQVDLASQRPDDVARLKEVLAAWRKEVDAAKLAPDSDAASKLSPEELERLRSLGYIR